MSPFYRHVLTPIRFVLFGNKVPANSSYMLGTFGLHCLAGLLQTSDECLLLAWGHQTCRGTVVPEKKGQYFSARESTIEIKICDQNISVFSHLDQLNYVIKKLVLNIGYSLLA